MTASTRVPWWRSIRLRIALGVSLAAVLATAGAGVLVDHRAAVADRERLRAQARGRLEAAAVTYGATGRLRLDAATGTAWLPETVRTTLRPGTVVTYFDGRAMWAARPTDPEPVLGVRLDASSLSAERAQRRRDVAVAGALAALLSLAAGWAVAEGLSRRLRRAAAATHRVTAGDADVRVAQRGSDEVAVLTAAVDAAAAALAHRLEVERAFTADVAHELRTPVTALVSATELLDDEPIAHLVRTQVRRLRLLVEDLLEISRIDVGAEPVVLDRHDLAPLVLDVVGHRLADRRPSLAIGAPAVVRTDRRRLERIVANLVGNAVRHAGHPGRLTVDGATITLDDDGPGYPEELLARGPQRFHAGAASAGSGLGLTIAVGHAIAIGATLTFANRPEGGARAVLALPERQG